MGFYINHQMLGFENVSTDWRSREPVFLITLIINNTTIICKMLDLTLHCRPIFHCFSLLPKQAIFWSIFEIQWYP